MNQELRQAAAQAKEALESAKAGLAWYRDTHPESVDGSDDEADEEIDAALSALSAVLEKQQDSEPTWKHRCPHSESVLHLPLTQPHCTNCEQPAPLYSSSYLAAPTDEARSGSGVPARPTSPGEFVSVPRELVTEIEREFVGLEDLPAWIRRMQDEVRACRAADDAGPTLGELIAKVGGRINDAGYVEFGSEMAVLAMVRHARKAASEPTEEMLAAVRQKPHPTRPDGWDAEHVRIWKAMFSASPLPQEGRTPL